MKPIKPSNTVAGKHVVFAENQPEYLPLPAVISEINPNVTVTEWELDKDEKSILNAGGHLFLQQMNFGQPLQPVNLQVHFEERGPTIVG
jgi:hypothetical protein